MGLSLQLASGGLSIGKDVLENSVASSLLLSEPPTILGVEAIETLKQTL